jgi:selenium-binding protein 1
MEHQHHPPEPFHASPREAMQAPSEEFLYLACLRTGTGVEKPDFLAVIDAENGEIVHELPMPNVGDELHHFGWNRCSSACHGRDRSHLIVPGFRSSRFHFVNVKDHPRKPFIEKVIEPEEVVAKTGYTRPHTVHCMPGDNIVVSMLVDADGNASGGFAVIDAQTFEVKGRWENSDERPPMNYDFWYQPRKNVLVSSEFGEPNAYEKGFDLADVESGRTASGSTSGISSGERSSRRWISARRASSRSRCAGSTTPTPMRASSGRRCRACCGTSTGVTAAGAPTR